MRIGMALNHSYLRNIASLPIDQAVSRLGALRRLRERAPRDLFCADPCRVHREVGATVVDASRSPPLTLVQWLTNPPLGEKSLVIRLRQETDWLLAHTRGPFWNDLLPLPDGSLIEPDVAKAEPHAQALLRHLLGHLSQVGAAPLCAVSPDDSVNLTEHEYRAEWSGQSLRVSNLRRIEDFESVRHQQGQQAVTFATAAEVLQYAQVESNGVLQVLPSAFASAAAFTKWQQRLSWTELLDCLIGLLHFRAARDDGFSDSHAMLHYTQVTGVKATAESRFTMANPACEQARTFQLPDGRREVFEPHAKPGNMCEPRIHFYWDGKPGQPSVVYIGHCGEHLRTS